MESPKHTKRQFDIKLNENSEKDLQELSGGVTSITVSRVKFDGPHQESLDQPTYSLNELSLLETPKKGELNKIN